MAAKSPIRKDAWQSVPAFLQRLIVLTPHLSGPKLLQLSKLDIILQNEGQLNKDQKAKAVPKKINQLCIVNAMQSINLSIPEDWDLSAIGHAVKTGMYCFLLSLTLCLSLTASLSASISLYSIIVSLF